MDCGRVCEMLAAYHDGELGAGVRARVEEHLRGCGECSGILERLARVDANVDVPDPGTEYWERFNPRVLERVDREGAPARATRPERRWLRRLPYFVPAAAAAALLVVILRQTGTDPFSRTARPPAPASPPEVSSQASPQPAPEPPAVAKPADRKGKKGPPFSAAPRPAAVAEGPGSLAPAGVGGPDRAGRDAREAPPLQAAPSREAFRDEAASPSRDGAAKEEAVQEERAGMAVPEAGARQALSKSAAPAAVPAPCPEARALADRGRLGEAESAQRSCLARRDSAQAREAGMIFLAELLDRQSRFTEADEVLEGTRREFPGSRPLDDYLRRRPRVQGRP